jgi:hypothetical protein
MALLAILKANREGLLAIGNFLATTTSQLIVLELVHYLIKGH